MRLLALETSTDACSAALYLDGEVTERFAIAPQRHAALILPMIDSLLREGGLRLPDIDAIAFGRGPGSFTGVRIGTAAAQGLALATGLPLLPVSTLAALAQQAMQEASADAVAAALDARMGEVYAGLYRRGESGLAEAECEECVCAPSAAPMPGGGLWLGAGSGWLAYADALTERFGARLAGTLPDCHPRAGAVARLAAVRFARGECVDVEAAQPVYLRDRVVQSPRG